MSLFFCVYTKLKGESLPKGTGSSVRMLRRYVDVRTSQAKTCGQARRVFAWRVFAWRVFAWRVLRNCKKNIEKRQRHTKIQTWAARNKKT